MRGSKALSVIALAGLVFMVAAEVFAGPACPPTGCAPPPACPPPMCGAPMFCPPPMCPPQVACMPPAYMTQCPPPCPPPSCAPPPCPPPMCGPPPCPPPRCRVNPVARLLAKTCDFVAEVVAFPFRVVDCVVGPLCDPPCGPRRVAAACPPPACPPPMCGPIDIPMPWMSGPAA